MKRLTLHALKGSILKWEAIAAGHGLDCGPNNCPLCQEFAGNGSVACMGCPVRDRTRRKYCERTPFIKWYAHQIDVHDTYSSNHVEQGCTTCQKLADAEVKFLKSLLPKRKPCKKKH